MERHSMNATRQPASTDASLRIVSDSRRRTALRHLLESGDGRISIHELAVAIANDDPAEQGDRVEQIERHMTVLHHVHLPKLADAGLVRYDKGDKTVRYHSHDAIEDLLQLVPETTG